MKTFCTILLLICFKLSTFAQDKGPKASQVLDDAVNKQECVGIAAGVSIQGATKWSDAKGYADSKTKTAFSTQTKNRIASITKPMTAVAILQLMEQKKLKLDDPISKYIASLPEHIKPITIQQLLEHSSGINAYKSNKEQRNKKEYKSMEEAMALFISRELLAAPGTAFNYTSYGYVVLGLIIEKTSGLSYEDYLKKNIWEKAGMQNTGVEDYGVSYSNKASLYHRNSKGKTKAAEATNLSDRIPGGGVYSTVEDLLKFGDAILTDRLITDASKQWMIKDNGFKKVGNPYGLGWYLYGENPDHGNVFGHNGAQIGSSCFLMLLPEKNTSIVVMSNTSGAMSTVSRISVQLFGLID